MRVAPCVLASVDVGAGWEQARMRRYPHAHAPCVVAGACAGQNSGVQRLRGSEKAPEGARAGEVSYALSYTITHIKASKIFSEVLAYFLLL